MKNMLLIFVATISLSAFAEQRSDDICVFVEGKGKVCVSPEEQERILSTPNEKWSQEAKVKFNRGMKYEKQYASTKDRIDLWMAASAYAEAAKAGASQYRYKKLTAEAANLAKAAADKAFVEASNYPKYLKNLGNFNINLSDLVDETLVGPKRLIPLGLMERQARNTAMSFSDGGALINEFFATCCDDNNQISKKLGEFNKSDNPKKRAIAYAIGESLAKYANHLDQAKILSEVSAAEKKIALANENLAEYQRLLRNITALLP